ncbi:hypothetical protein OS122_04645 [Mycolicibacterium mucogenicum]|uniref:hypothetical protein n=1 Tax=Mycolicibacterium mucogenicum TaxID=56689 RepID=UPI00226A31B7|nr:hypothetical protein [Mycolicibacterium mucogenicum]MCX8560180.1 hypothetical protein [Mycolicibacterium mucogenicum]
MLTHGPAIEVREPTGLDELLLLETRLPPAAALAALCDRVATVHGHPLDWQQVAATQLGAVALAVRRAWIGDRVLSEGFCPAPGCGERVDVSFSGLTYLAHYRPGRPRNLRVGDDGWFQLASAPVRFRIPSVADLLAAGASGEPTATLAARCLEPAQLPTRTARAVDRALAVLAPSLEGLIGGQCPACGTDVTMRFDPLTYTVLELKDSFAGIYREAHALASAYGWPEETILGQPRSRRRRYAELIFESRSAPRRAVW